MSRTILWFWYLVLIWFASFCITSRLVSAAEDTKVERSFSSRVKSFILGSDELSKIPAKSPITVIASRLPSFKTPLNSIPANVSYLDKEDLKKIKPRTFQDAVRPIEGATFNDNVGNDWDTNFGLRGFSGSSNINFLVDGVRVNEPDQNVMTFPLVSMDDIESVQINRGSQSPVYGTQAFAGVVNITTGQPSPKPLHLFGGFEWGSFDSFNFYQGASGTLHDHLTPVQGNLKYYAKIGRNMGEGWLPNDEWRITSVDTKLAYELPDNEGQAYVNVKYMQDRISNPGEVTLQQFQNDFGEENKPLDGRAYRNTIIQIGADKKFWDDRITASIMNSWRPNRTFFYSTVGTFTAFGQNPYTSLATVKSEDQNLIAQLKYEDDFIEHIHNESQFGMEFRDQNHNATERDVVSGIATSPNGPLRTDRQADINNTAIFWRESLKFWNVVAPYFGMRHDFNWLKTRNFLNQGTNVSRRWRASTISTGVNITPVSFSDLFFNYSQGFRVPSISEVSPFSTTVPAPDLDPERSNSYEAGTRLRYKDIAVYKAAYFIIDTQDEIAFVINQNVNINKSRRYGIEQRIDLTPVGEVNFYGSYTWMRAYVRETTPSNNPVDGRELGQIPENRFTLGTTLVPFKRLNETLAGFKLNLDGVFTGTQHPESFQSYSQAVLNATGSEGHEIPAYNVWNFMASFEWKGKMIYFKINNLFDERYYSRARAQTSSGTAIYPAGTYVFVNQGAPREYLLGMTWEFGN